MKRILVIVGLAILLTACTTTATIRIPQGSKLYLNNNPEPVAIKEDGQVTTRPFFWSAVAGIPYRVEQDGAVARRGKLQARFRPASIFWPPFAFAAIYWPVGFALSEYDLTGASPAPASAKAETRIDLPATQQK